jgi:hypothetical protein
MAFKKPTSHGAVPDSPDRLFRDLVRRRLASLYDHQGQMLRTYATTAVKKPDVALQLPTGSGKTLVGLLLAEWRRRKFRERIVYLCPTRQLVNQVVEEALTKYGISVEPFTGRIRDYSPDAKAAYVGADRVAVTTYNSLFNTNPFFKDPEVIILDDAHAAENYIGSQWTVHISRLSADDQDLFKAVAAVLKSVLPDVGYARLIGKVRSHDDVSWVDKIPTAKMAANADELRVAVDENIEKSEQRYAWQMIREHLRACQVYISSTEIMIRPLIAPTWTHSAFADATQRIFMSATLGAGGDLERLTGRADILRLPIPDGWDRQGIGRRFFVFPEKSLKEPEWLILRREFMKTAGRSLVLTPNNELASEISKDVQSTLKCPVFSAADLESGKTAFTKASPAVAVIANRYDGIDFPDDDCRLMFIEGLPRAMNLQERFLMNRMGANLLFNERIQTRVLQAVGRCTRGLNDYSAVVTTGEDLPAYLTDQKRRRFFHPELQAELAFGIEQSTEVDAGTFRDNLRIFLEHDAEWEHANDNILEARATATQSEFPAMNELAKVVPHEIAWQESLWNEDYASAYEAAREVLGGLNDSGLRGYRALWHYLAGSAAELAGQAGDSSLASQAKQQYAKAKQAAAGIPWLVSLARGGGVLTAEEEQHAAVMFQVERLEGYLTKLGTVHNRSFSAREKEIRDGLKTASTFEQAQVALGEHLGFAAGKREVEASPDPWWQAGNIVIVFEDHVNANPGTGVVDATKARQAASHPNWVRESVPGAAEAQIYPVLVTVVTKMAKGAAPHLQSVFHWSAGDFRAWSEEALVAVRALRRDFVEPGDLIWRAQAAEALANIHADAAGLAEWLSKRPARHHLNATG